MPTSFQFNLLFLVYTSHCILGTDGDPYGLPGALYVTTDFWMCSKY